MRKSFNNSNAPLAAKTIELHAGAAYSDAIRERLREMGATVNEPLHGLTLGPRLAWYNGTLSANSLTNSPTDHRRFDAQQMIEELTNGDRAQRPAEFLTTDSKGLLYPGLYSWWVDDDGAADLSVGLGIEVSPGLIYAGQAGATRARSGLKSTNTLWGRIRGMHLGGRHEFSTFRRSLGSILANSRGDARIDEVGLTAWMHAHLQVLTVAVNDADSLNDLETEVLLAVDPPLNLAKLVKTPVRSRLSELRRSFSQ